MKMFSQPFSQRFDFVRNQFDVKMVATIPFSHRRNDLRRLTIFVETRKKIVKKPSVLCFLSTTQEMSSFVFLP
jgi:hypothetical protein